MIVRLCWKESVLGRQCVCASGSEVIEQEGECWSVCDSGRASKRKSVSMRMLES